MLVLKTQQIIPTRARKLQQNKLKLTLWESDTNPFGIWQFAFANWEIWSNLSLIYILSLPDFAQAIATESAKKFQLIKHLYEALVKVFGFLIDFCILV